MTTLEPASVAPTAWVAVAAAAVIGGALRAAVTARRRAIRRRADENRRWYELVSRLDRERAEREGR